MNDFGTEARFRFDQVKVENNGHLSVKTANEEAHIFYIFLEGAAAAASQVAKNSPSQAAAKGTCSQSASTGQSQNSSSSKTYSIPAKQSTAGQLISDGWREDDEEDRRRMNKFKYLCERNVANRFIRA